MWAECRRWDLVKIKIKKCDLSKNFMKSKKRDFKQDRKGFNVKVKNENENEKR